MSSPPGDRGVLVADRWWSKLPRPAYGNLKRIPVTDEWFGVYETTPETCAIYEGG